MDVFMATAPIPFPVRHWHETVIRQPEVIYVEHLEQQSAASFRDFLSLKCDSTERGKEYL
jgi:hypothetical protein